MHIRFRRYIRMWQDEGKKRDFIIFCTVVVVIERSFSVVYDTILIQCQTENERKRKKRIKSMEKTFEKKRMQRLPEHFSMLNWSAIGRFYSFCVVLRKRTFFLPSTSMDFFSIIYYWTTFNRHSLHIISLLKLDWIICSWFFMLI